MKKIICTCVLSVIAFSVQLHAKGGYLQINESERNPTSLEYESLLTPSETDQQVKVVLKNGATITGFLKSFDPVTSIVLIVAGQETNISMKNVESVEVIGTSKADTNASKLGDQKLLVTETAAYPSEISVLIGEEVVKMLLVKGGHMNMGYDGNHSWTMESEPVHEVEVTSFYISERPLTKSLVSKYCRADADENGAALVGKYKDVETAINGIASLTGKPYRLPTEAEWEYAASGELQEQIFADVAHKKKIAYDWCSDFYDEFKTGGKIIDPTGPAKGKDKVVRAFNNKYGKYDRRNELSVGRYTLGCIRLVIKAKEINN